MKFICFRWCEQVSPGSSTHVHCDHWLLLLPLPWHGLLTFSEGQFATSVWPPHYVSAEGKIGFRAKNNLRAFTFHNQFFLQSCDKYLSTTNKVQFNPFCCCCCCVWICLFESFGCLGFFFFFVLIVLIWVFFFCLGGLFCWAFFCVLRHKKLK